MMFRSAALTASRSVILAAAFGVCLSALNIGRSAAQDETAPSVEAISDAPPDLFLILSLDYRADDVAAALTRAINNAGHECPRVSDYQTFSSSNDRRVLKIKCPGEPVFGATIYRDGTVLVYGGDGMIQPLDLDDGEVVTVFGTPIGESTAAARADRRRARAEVPQIIESRRTPPWLVALIIVNAILLALLVSAFVIFWRAEGRRVAELGENLGRLTSERKDAMLDVSEEILPRIFQHPDGMFIVRGRHGKRRVFRNMLFALLYRDFGMKLREVR